MTIALEHGVRGRNAQATQYRRRARRLALNSPETGLFQTHQFVAADNPIDTDGVFTDRELGVAVRSNTISFTATNQIDDSASELDAFAIGDRLRVRDLDGGANDGLIVTVSTVTAAQIIINETSITTQIAGDSIVLSRVLAPFIAPITFAFRIQRDTVAGDGIIFEFGSSTQGGGAWIESGATIGACAGQPAPDGADITVASVLNADGAAADVVVAIAPAIGVVNLWVDGILRGSAISAADFGDGWTDVGDGAVADVAGTRANRFGTAAALTNASLIGPVRTYFNQLPRNFHRAGFGTDGGSGSWTN